LADVRARPEVIAAVAKVGRINRYPVPDLGEIY
jgi:hypothetical protein